MHNKLMKTKELAEALSVHPGSVRRWMANDRYIPAIKINGTYRFKFDEVYEYLKKKSLPGRYPEQPKL